MSKANAVTEKKENAVAVYDYGDSAGAGYENLSSDDYSVPFIILLQSNSPEVENNEPEGARGGMFLNRVTNELTPGDTGIVVVPCYSHTVFEEWVPRDNGGGYVAPHAVDSAEVYDAIKSANGKFGKLRLGANDLIETHYVYVLLLNNEGNEITGFAAIPIASTKIKPKKDWLTAMRHQGGDKTPLFANRARIKVVRKENKKGNFYGLVYSPLIGKTYKESLINPQTELHLLEEAKKFYGLVSSGKAKVNAASQGQATMDMEAQAAGDENAPF
jgi:hypothetical protein